MLPLSRTLELYVRAKILRPTSSNACPSQAYVRTVSEAGSASYTFRPRASSRRFGRGRPRAGRRREHQSSARPFLEHLELPPLRDPALMHVSSDDELGAGRDELAEHVVAVGSAASCARRATEAPRGGGAARRRAERRDGLPGASPSREPAARRPVRRPAGATDEPSSARRRRLRRLRARAPSLRRRAPSRRRSA